MNNDKLLTFVHFRVPIVITKARVDLRVRLLWFSMRIQRIKFPKLYVGVITTWHGCKSKKCHYISMLAGTRQSCLTRSDIHYITCINKIPPFVASRYYRSEFSSAIIFWVLNILIKNFS